mmetsp:Transcript_30374/g.51164  ORF Transcript_30374/g.51164 Transcript_30374/m.51164 type:complete len:199 (-) Transcript_30374:84-680(-)
MQAHLQVAESEGQLREMSERLAATEQQRRQAVLEGEGLEGLLTCVQEVRQRLEGEVTALQAQVERAEACHGRAAEEAEATCRQEIDAAEACHQQELATIRGEAEAACCQAREAEARAHHASCQYMADQPDHQRHLRQAEVDLRRVEESNRASELQLQEANQKLAAQNEEKYTAGFARGFAAGCHIRQKDDALKRQLDT